MVEFRREFGEARLYAPPDFRLETQTVEYRFDPLTGIRSRINVKRALRPIQMEVDADVAGFIEKTRANCPFCPENIERNTPLFLEDVWRGGRIKNECYVFPNRYPFAEHHAVATITSKHFLDLDEFTPEMIAENMLACIRYVIIVNEKYSEAKYPLWLWNHLPSAAASIIHPHTQIIVDRKPTIQQKLLLDRSRRYFSRTGKCYWTDLIEAEKDGDRWIGEGKYIAVIASFAPQANREIQLIFKDAFSLSDIGRREVGELADFLSLILRFYRINGVNSFNISTFSAGIGENPKYYRLNVRIASRPYFRPYYTAYGGVLEIWHGECVSETLPEDIARKLKKYLKIKT
jgi:UDPglucose--hexose-1-phosphate uridylyltransferase